MSAPRRISSIGVFAFFSLVVVAPIGSQAAPTVTVYDVSQSGVQPPAQQDRAAAFLVIGLNPLLGQTVVATQSVKSNSSTAATQSTAGAPSAKKGAGAPPAIALCANATSDSDRNNYCTTAMTYIDNQLLTPVGNMQSTSATDLQNQAANLVANALQQVHSVNDPKAPTTTTYYDELSAAPSLSQAAAVYGRFVSSLTVSDTDTTAPLYTGNISQYGTTAVGTIVNAQLVNQAIVLAAMQSVKSPVGAYTTAASLVTSALTYLQGSTVAAIEAAANKYVNQIKEIPTNPNTTYYIVNAFCASLGFSSSTWTIVLNQTAGSTSATPTKVWEDDVTCYPELSVGAMYYASSLNTTSYTLQSKPSGSSTINVPVQQNNNWDQGSFSGALNVCPNGGPNAWCGVLTLGSDTNGLNGGVGGGYMFMHRVIGVFGGVRIGQTNVLQKGYTAGVTQVMNGASYTYKEIGLGAFIGISLNIPTSK